VLAAEDPLLLGEQRLVDRDRLTYAPGVPVGAGERLAGAERVGVLGAEDPLLVGVPLRNAAPSDK
jgi:hypothetical protein